MKADDVRLLDYIGQPKRTFSIPVYQRNYDWNQNHCKRLFLDIEKLCNDVSRTHFLGTIVYVDGKTGPIHRDLVIIDGQQRLTSTMLLLKALHRLELEEDVQDDIKQSFLINRNSKEKYKLKLKPVEAESELYTSIIEDKNIESKASLYRNYEHFIELIENSTFDTNTILEAMHRLEIVAIQIDRSNENPQLIFESLNSTGLNLTQADLVRNFLLMGHDYDTQKNLYTNYWRRIEANLTNSKLSDFLRDYLTLKTSNIPKKELVYEAFKDYYYSAKNYDSEGFLDELLLYSKYYSWFLFGRSGSQEIDVRLSEIQLLKSTVTYPFFLNVFEDCYEYNSMNEAELIKVLDLTISFIFRRLVCELPTNALNKVFSKLSRDLKRSWHDQYGYYKNLAIVLFKKQSSSLFPRDEHFRNSLSNRDFYSFKHKKYALSKIERNQSKERVDIENLTIEHIMPQKLTPKWMTELGKDAERIHEKYLHRLGNLTLTGYNPELSTKAFSEKKALLRESNLRINRRLAELNQWTSDEITNRANELSDVCLNIWEFPQLELEDCIEKSELTNEFDIMDEVNVTGRKPMDINFIGEMTPVKSWREFFSTICQKAYEYDDEVFSKLIGHSDFIGRNREIISSSNVTMNEPVEITDGVYVETKLSANDSLNYSKMVIEKFEELETEISYRIK